MKAICNSFEKYKPIRPPKCNCMACWDLYFRTHSGETLAAKMALQHTSRATIVKVKGEVYVKFLEAHLQLVEERQKQLEVTEPTEA